MKFAKATATAAMVPVWITRNNDQPNRNPIEGPYASRRKTYWPPACGHIAASSAQQSAPVIVRTPARAQATINQPGEPTCRADSAEVMKMPEPIIDPTTIMVASSRPNPRTSLVCRVSAFIVRDGISANEDYVKEHWRFSISSVATVRLAIGNRQSAIKNACLTVPQCSNSLDLSRG